MSPLAAAPPPPQKRQKKQHPHPSSGSELQIESDEDAASHDNDEGKNEQQMEWPAYSMLVMSSSNNISLKRVHLSLLSFVHAIREGMELTVWTQKGFPDSTAMRKSIFMTTHVQEAAQAVGNSVFFDRFRQDKRWAKKLGKAVSSDFCFASSAYQFCLVD